jgi:hypothetical protein
MEHDYNLLIENLKGRRYDEALKESVLSDGFENSNLPDSVKYALESMCEIDVSYAYKVYHNSRRIHEIIHKELKKRNIEVDYRYQGSLKTFTNILLYGEVELIVLKKNPSDKPHNDVQELGQELMGILSGDHNFKSVDFDDKTRIKICAQKPTCEIDILPSVWVDTPKYNETKNEIYRAIVEYDFIHQRVKKYLPFLNIARFNSRDQHTNGILKSLTRLLVTLKNEQEENIDLRDSELRCILYAIPEEDLKVDSDLILSLLPLVEHHLSKLITDDEHFKSLRSPSKMEKVFASQPHKKDELKKILDNLQTLIKNIKKDLTESGKSLEDRLEYYDL